MQQLIKKLTRFRQFNIGPFIDLYLFQRGRWELGITLDCDVEYSTKKIQWDTWLFCINIIFIHLEFHGREKEYNHNW